jgi:hypothetical protein
LLAAVRLDRVNAYSSIKKGDQNCSFNEYKFVVEVPSKRSRLSTMQSPVARLRGGGVIAVKICNRPIPILIAEVNTITYWCWKSKHYHVGDIRNFKETSIF